MYTITLLLNQRDNIMLWSRLGKNNKGITLIELIVAMALTAIILTASTRIMMPIYRLYHSNLEQSNAIRVSGEIEKELRKKITSAVDMSVIEDKEIISPIKDHNYIYIRGGRIYYEEVIDLSNRDEIPLLSDQSYEGFKVAWTIEPDYLRFYQNNASILVYNELKFNLSLINEDDEVVTTRLIAIQLINMLDMKDFYQIPLVSNGVRKIQMVKSHEGLTITDKSGDIAYGITGTTITLSRQIEGDISIVTAAGDKLYEGPRSIYEERGGYKLSPSEKDYYSIRYR